MHNTGGCETETCGFGVDLNWWCGLHFRLHKWDPHHSWNSHFQAIKYVHIFQTHKQKQIPLSLMIVKIQIQNCIT